MLVTLEGLEKEIEVKPEQLENASSAMLVTLEGITIEVNGDNQRILPFFFVATRVRG